jgi:hypothetical protein
MAETMEKFTMSASAPAISGVRPDSLRVDASGLRAVAQDLNVKREEIMNVYTGSLKQIIESSKQCISTSGLDFDQVNSVFAKTFSSLDSSIGELSDVLINKIIPSYEDLSAEIRTVFNSEFADQLASILGIQ